MKERLVGSLVILAVLTALILRGPASGAVRPISLVTTPEPVHLESEAVSFRGDAARTGRQPGPGPSGQPVLRWRADMQQAFGGGITIADGIAYMADGEEGHLRAVDAATGQEIWRHERSCDMFSCSVVSAPAVASGLVFVSTTDGGYAFDAVTGEQRWRYVGASSIFSSPIVMDNTVYFSTGASRVAGSTLAAIEAETGLLRWRNDSLSPIAMPPALAGGTIYVASGGFGTGDVLHALDSETGRELASFSDDGTEGFRAAIDGGTVYLATQTNLIALDAETLQERWRVDSDLPLSAPAVAEGIVYVATGERLVAYDAATGSSRWELAAEVVGDPSVTDGVIYAPGLDFVIAVDAATGIEHWRFGGAGQVVWAVADGLVFASGNARAGSLAQIIVAIGGSEHQATPRVSSIASPVATPVTASTPIAAGRSLCQVTPRRVFDLLDMAPTSPVTATLQASPETELPPFQPPSGPPADPTIIAGIEATAREELACRNDGKQAAGLALFTDDYLRLIVSRQSVSELLRPTTTSPDEQLVVAEIRDVTLLPDGQAGAIIVYRDPVLHLDVPATESLHLVYAVFAQVGDRWLFDDQIPLPAPSASIPAATSTDGGPAIDVRDSGDVPMFQGGPDHLGVHPGPNPIGIPSLAWQFDDPDLTFIGPPAVVDGVVYVGSGIGLSALDLTSGDEHGRFPTRGQVESTPAVAGGLVYFGSDDGSIYAIDAASGTLRWEVKTGGTVVSSPAVIEGVLFVGSYDGNVYALDAATGAERWRFATDAQVFASPAVAGGLIYIGSVDLKGETYTGTFYALDAASGTPVWTMPLGTLASAVVADGVVYVPSLLGTVHALDATSGAVLWRAAIAGGVAASPTVADETVYLGSYDGLMHALNAASGQERWRFATGDDIRAAAVVVDGVVYVANEAGTLYAINATTGSEMWRFATGGEVIFSPVVIGGMVLIGSDDGVLYALSSGVAGPGTPAAIGAMPVSPVATPVTSARAGDIPAPEECRVEPRDHDEFALLLETAANDALVPNAATPAAGTSPTSAAIQSGDPANPDTVLAIESAVREFIACNNAGDWARLLAQYTDEYWQRAVATDPEFPVSSFLLLLDEPPVALPEADRISLISVRDVHVLADGRVGAIVTVYNPASPEPERTSFLIFVFDGERWLLDDFIEELDAATPTAAKEESPMRRV